MDKNPFFIAIPLMNPHFPQTWTFVSVYWTIHKESSANVENIWQQSLPISPGCNAELSNAYARQMGREHMRKTPSRNHTYHAQGNKPCTYASTLQRDCPVQEFTEKKNQKPLKNGNVKREFPENSKLLFLHQK